MNVLGLVLLIGLGSARADVADRLAAVVNDDVITLSEVYELGRDYIEDRAGGAAGNPGARRLAELEVLDSLVQRRLISQEITRLELDVTEVELERSVDDIAHRNGLDRETLRSEVETSGLPWDQYRDELRENLRQMKFSQAVIRPRIAVNEDELQDAYRRLTNDAALPLFAELGAIFLKGGANLEEEARAALVTRAEEIRTRLSAGEDFATVAAEVDEGLYGAQGGRMGRYRQGELVGELDEVAFGLEVGQTSAPLETTQGVFLLHLFDVERADPPALEDVRDQLFEQVYADRIEQETELWTEQARRRAAVELMLEDVDGQALPR